VALRDGNHSRSGDAKRSNDAPAFDFPSNNSGLRLFAGADLLRVIGFDANGIWGRHGRGRHGATIPNEQ